MAESGDQLLHDFQIHGVDHSYATLGRTAGGVVDPEISLIVLKGESHRHHADIDRIDYFPGWNIYHCECVGGRHGDVESFVIGSHHPIFPWTRDRDKRVKILGAGTPSGVDPGNVWFVFQRGNEVGVQIDGGTFAKTRLQKRLHLLATLTRAYRAVCLALIEPRHRSQIRERHTAIAASDLEPHRRLLTRHNFLKLGTRRRRSELDRDTLRVKSLWRFVLSTNA